MSFICSSKFIRSTRFSTSFCRLKKFQNTVGLSIEKSSLWEFDGNDPSTFGYQRSPPPPRLATLRKLPKTERSELAAQMAKFFCSSISFSNFRPYRQRVTKKSESKKLKLNQLVRVEPSKSHTLLFGGDDDLKNLYVKLWDFLRCVCLRQSGRDSLSMFLPPES
jgi:hypothetical protein